LYSDGAHPLLDFQNSKGLITILKNGVTISLNAILETTVAAGQAEDSNPEG
jgi:hypothetical protein